jgi:alpha-tubulin suppressor-like RCC1 family protein
MFGLVVLASGEVIGYGINNYFQLGDDRDKSNRKNMLLNISHVATVAAGYDFSVFLKDDGTVWTCGNNEDFQLGYATARPSSQEIRQVPNLDDVICISCGYHYTVAVKADGTIYTWGIVPEKGGPEEMVLHSTPTPLEGIHDAVDVACGKTHFVIIHKNRTISAIGGRQTPDIPTPWLDMTQHPICSPIILAACGDWHTSLIDEDDRIRVFGSNDFGQLDFDPDDGQRQ